MSDTNEYMTRDVIKEQCLCEKKHTCMVLASVLASGKITNLDIVDSLFDTIKQNGDIHKAEGR
jgi:hypothetical protein